MNYYTTIDSPLGTLTAGTDGVAITGLWMQTQRISLPKDSIRQDDHPVFQSLIHWLDAYFSGGKPVINFPLAPAGTAFQKRVWQALEAIPYGEWVTYGELGRRVGCNCARALGQAVGRNPISIVIPCHRVLGSDNRLTGYDGGLENKIFLLNLERIPYKK